MRIFIILCIELFVFIQQTKAAGDLSLPSSGVKISNDLNLYYEIDSTKITILVEAKAMGWVGIGFSSTMINCDMAIFNSNTGTV